MNRFDAPWSRYLLLVTLLGTLVLVVVPLALLWLYRFHGALALAVFLPVVLWAATLPFMVTGYEISAGQLQILRPGWSTVYRLRELRAAEQRPGAMARSLQLFANGGLFSITGWYRNKALGRYRAFVTDPARCVVLRFTGRTIVLSPAEPERFVAAVGPYLPGGGGR